MNTDRLRHSIIIATFLILCSCGNDHTTLGTIDLVQWKSDRNACGGLRTRSVEELQQHKNELLGLSESEVIALLGKPDQNELYKRNQKFYYYFLEPAPSCASAAGNPKRLMVRFNAVGLAKEVSIQ